ncbi:BREX-1 system adenine-specific DNA-methyltransferase PglX [Pseudomonas fulva]|uniref:BREX-1 system adenine-specific DNA-methyltransferase PglX n=1 Tax=Pseudomonas fulva TaxID=47880 RepID=UPI00384BA2C3
METTKLKKFAQAARTDLRRQVETKLIQVLHASSAARREIPQAVAQLERQIQASGKEQVIERVAYTWFNRFCALRFLDANGFTNPRVLTPMEGQITPEILAEAKMGHLDDELVAGKTREKVLDLLAGNAPSSDPQGEAYRQLLVSVCNHWYRHMPFLFEQIDDYTELLMPEDLLSQGSIITSLREVMTEEVCKDVEVIGWLYQYYIAEKKDEVFAGLKKNIKITPENIPAATQLFTPHWIVRYLVENSLGRLWLLNRPRSKLAEKMDYYIAPEESEKDFLRISSPEEIRVCDPACGSGHMLTYAFDLLYAIYEEEGYDPTEIPALILTHNLYGVEIDERAGALAAFALVMKAGARLGRRRFLRMEAQPNICVLENVSFTQDELRDVVAIMGRDLFTDELRETLCQFEHAKNFGSLIVPKLRDPAETLRAVEARDFGGDLLLKEVQERVVAVLGMAEMLSPKYHVVVANPPYAGAKGLNGELGAWVKKAYPESKSDLMTCFMERSCILLKQHGYWGMITLPAWMFLGSYEKLRNRLLVKSTFESLVHLGRGIFGADFGSTAFVLSKRTPTETHHVHFRQLFEDHVQVRSSETIRELFLDKDYGRFVTPQKQLSLIPGAPLAYWAKPATLNAFSKDKRVQDIGTARQGIATADNDRFLKQWFEVGHSNISFDSREMADFMESRKRWLPHKKGGEFRRWSGNNDYILDWRNGGFEIVNNDKARAQNIDFWFRKGVTWSHTSSGSFSARVSEGGFSFNCEGPTLFTDDPDVTLGMLCSNAALHFMKIMNPTLHFLVGSVSVLPVPQYLNVDEIRGVAKKLEHIGTSDWDAYEISWDFTKLPLLSAEHRAKRLEGTYARLRAFWQGLTNDMQRLEEENNRIFIDSYGLQDELTPKVAVDEITLTCNPAYRYGGKATEDELEERLRADTMAELLSYAVGCMFGRYSLDKPGLVLANQGDTLADYLGQVPEPRFMPDEDNVIPVLDGEWFADDVTERFRQFLRVTFGEEHYEENLAFIEKALGKDVRKYFLKDFYADHVKRYKKRPIYWLFSSPKGTFSALVYLHRYRPDTVSVVLQYLRDFRKKLAARLDYLQQVAISTSVTQGEKTKANKEAESIKKQLLELDDYERETLYPLATEQLQLDLDDGVKVNYLKLGAALKKITGLEAKED